MVFYEHQRPKLNSTNFIAFLVALICVLRITLRRYRQKTNDRHDSLQSCLSFDTRVKCSKRGRQCLAALLSYKICYRTLTPLYQASSFVYFIVPVANKSKAYSLRRMPATVRPESSGFASAVSARKRNVVDSWCLTL
jgi:hypothetical protein